MTLAGLITGAILSIGALIAFGVQMWALFDCVKAKPSEFEAAFKRSKGFWTAITAVSALMGFFYLFSAFYAGLGIQLILNLAACVGAGIYLADVRPALRQVRRGGGRSQGPYGPW